LNHFYFFPGAPQRKKNPVYAVSSQFVARQLSDPAGTAENCGTSEKANRFNKPTRRYGIEYITLLQTCQAARQKLGQLQPFV
jgi:hypothetical protein